MHENNLYNLMMQSVQEHKSLWRIINDYRADAEGSEEAGTVRDEELLAFWEQLATEKANQLAEIQRLIGDRSTPEALAAGANEPDEVAA